nr:hypothetical protein [Tanacetum cinerariifolium]
MLPNGFDELLSLVLVVVSDLLFWWEGLYGGPRDVVLHLHRIAPRDLSRGLVRLRLDQLAQPGKTRPILHGALPRPGGRGLASSPNSFSWPTLGTSWPPVKSTCSTGEDASHFAWDLKISYASCSGVKEKPNWGRLPDEGVGEFDEEDELGIVTPRRFKKLSL